MGGFPKEDYGLFLIEDGGPWVVEERRQELRAVSREESFYSAAWISLNPFSPTRSQILSSLTDILSGTTAPVGSGGNDFGDQILESSCSTAVTGRVRWPLVPSLCFDFF